MDKLISLLNAVREDTYAEQFIRDAFKEEAEQDAEGEVLNLNRQATKRAVEEAMMFFGEWVAVKAEQAAKPLGDKKRMIGEFLSHVRELCVAVKAMPFLAKPLDESAPDYELRKKLYDQELEVENAMLDGQIKSVESLQKQIPAQAS